MEVSNESDEFEVLDRLDGPGVAIGAGRATDPEACVVVEGVGAVTFKSI